MKEEDRNLIIKNIGEIINDAENKNIKVKNIENFFCKILDCHDKIKEERDILVLKRAKAGWDILLPCYNYISLPRNRGLPINTIENNFSNKWISLFAELDSKCFEYEKIRLPTIQEEEANQEQNDCSGNNGPKDNGNDSKTLTNALIVITNNPSRIKDNGNNAKTLTEALIVRKATLHTRYNKYQKTILSANNGIL